MSEWLDIMLEEIDRKKQESVEAEEEAARRSRPDPTDKAEEQERERPPG